MSYKTIDACRLCGSLELIELFSLGEQWVSDFVTADKVRSGPRVPIELVQCGHCTLVQQCHTAPQDFLYTRHYWYRSGTTATMRAALEDITTVAERLVGLKPSDIVLDIGANDGTLLNQYLLLDQLVRVAVEPATNLAEDCRQRCEVFIGDFWSAESYYTAMNHFSPKHETRFREHQAKVVTAIGMFYDLEWPSDFIADVAKVLAPDGLFIAQLMCLKNMMALGDVGNLAHEHLEFYSLRSLQHLFGKHGLELFDVETNAVNGESYRLLVRHKGSRVGEENGIGFRELRRAERLRSAVEWEEEHLHGLALRREFGRWETNGGKVYALVRELASSGKRVWIYGASTKGNVIAQWLQLDDKLIEAAADVSQEKQGKYMVGTGVPIHGCEEFRAARPDFALVLPYAFRDEFIEREREWLDGGGKFIFPLPQLEVYP